MRHCGGCEKQVPGRSEFCKCGHDVGADYQRCLFETSVVVSEFGLNMKKHRVPTSVESHGGQTLRQALEAVRWP
jgi:hypothetical protein